MVRVSFHYKVAGNGKYIEIICNVVKMILAVSSVVHSYVSRRKQQPETLALPQKKTLAQLTFICDHCDLGK
jgi:hypothetical protein